MNTGYLDHGREINNDTDRAKYWFQVANDQIDFLEWLFDTELDYLSQKEMWHKFEQYQDGLIEKQEHERSVATVDAQRTEP